MRRRELLKGLGAAALMLQRRPKADLFPGFPTHATLGPIIASPNGRYLVNAGSNKPFLLMADSPQSLVNIYGSDIDYYLGTRASQGFNAVQWDLITTSYTGARYPYGANSPSGAIFAFTNNGALTPSWAANSTYWSLMQTYLRKCLNNGLVAVLNPYETGDGLADLVNAGAPACYSYGQYIGGLFAGYPNVMWELGNDCHITDSTEFNAISNLALGILSKDTAHLMTIELYYNQTTAFDATGCGTFSPIMNLNGSYTYGPTYGYDMIAYNPSSVSFEGAAGTNKTGPVPSILLEANYEYEQIGGPSTTDGGYPLNLRRQGYWSVLAGQSGQLYGNGYIWPMAITTPSNVVLSGGSRSNPVWRNNLSSPGIADLQRWHNFFTSIAWYNLIPDQSHAIGRSGYGTAALRGLFASNNYVTVAADSVSGRATLAVAYFPQGDSNTLTIDLSKFASAVTAEWFDPTNASHSAIGTYSPSGTNNFSPSGNNSAGDPDWVLLLTA